MASPCSFHISAHRVAARTSAGGHDAALISRVRAAGYQEQKQVIEDGLLSPLTHPEVYEAVAAKTRESPGAGSNRPRAVLFEGPPGCGKTTSARSACQAVESSCT